MNYKHLYMCIDLQKETIITNHTWPAHTDEDAQKRNKKGFAFLHKRKQHEGETDCFFLFS